MGTAWGGAGTANYTAAVDLTGKNRLFAVADGTDPTTIKVCGAGEAARGAFDLTTPTVVGAAVTVLIDGVVPVIAGTALTAGMLVASDSLGRAVEAAPGDYVLGDVWVGCGITGDVALIRLRTHPAPALLAPVLEGTVTLDFGSMPTLTDATATGTIPGALVGDRVTLMPPATLEAGIVPISAHITGTNTVTARAYNATAGTVDPASAAWAYTLRK